MISIIGGKLKGRKLNSIKINSVRPTQAKIRKSIMDIIYDFENKAVLDLYSGFGTLGIECLSRGAKSVDFVEKDYKVIKVLRQNVDSLGLHSRCSIFKSCVLDFLNKSNNKYDIIFADPPYETCDFTIILSEVKNKLNLGGIFCFESNKLDSVTDEAVRVKIYGDTQITFWENKT